MALKEVLCPTGCGTMAYEYPGGVNEYDTYGQDHPGHKNVSCPNCSREGGPVDVRRLVDYCLGEGLKLWQIRRKIRKMKKDYKNRENEFIQNKSSRIPWSS